MQTSADTRAAPAAVGHTQSLDALDRGGLAGAVRAEDPEDLALLDGERHAVDDTPAAIGLPQLTDFDNRPTGRRPHTLQGHTTTLAESPPRPNRPSGSTGHHPIG
jgi:hypothetical protein